MIRRTVLIATAVLAFVAVGAGAPRTQLPPPQQLLLAGWVRMTTSPNGLATVVTITTRQWTEGRLEAEDWAFRLQHAKPQYLAFEGQAEVAYDARCLMVLPGRGGGWQFLVAEGLPDDLLEPSEVQRYAVAGLSRHWGGVLQFNQDAASSALLAGACTASAGAGAAAGDCDACQPSGGDASCTATCGGTDTCTVECASSYRACCSCPDSCFCCSGQIQTMATPAPR